MKLLFILVLGYAGSSLARMGSCEVSFDGLDRAEKKILKSSMKAQSPEQIFAQISEPLECIMKIQKRSSGILKGVANQVLQPFLGGTKTKGVPAHPSYEKVAKAMLALSESSLRLSPTVLGVYANGTWDFYQKFCGHGKLGFCDEFLPGRKEIEKQSSLIGASSILMLKVAYLSLGGTDRKKLESRIRQLHAEGHFSDPLKQRAIEEVFEDLFVPGKQPLSMSMAA